MKAFPDEDFLLFQMTMNEEDFDMMFGNTEDTVGYCIVNLNPADDGETFLKWNDSYYVKITGGHDDWSYMANCKGYHYDTNCSSANFEKILNDPRMFTLENINDFYMFFNASEPFYPYTEYVSFGEPSLPVIIAKVVDSSILDNFTFDNFLFRDELYVAVYYDESIKSLKIKDGNFFGYTMVSALPPVVKKVIKGVALHYQLEIKADQLWLTVK